MSDPKPVTLTAQVSALCGLLNRALPHALKKAGVVGSQSEGQLLIDRLGAALNTLRSLESAPPEVSP
ncbi:hypothetical protein RA307_04845 [Xanthobacteraceae bacterium Astr-EGSB]|uniref:hypothetical protein n=1 Tax=Astrobacterium formosum TaxID=3069710 RepID=UPI0027B6C12B|nr:hypothetical protein [Xanthobacteraceae bacterium Astr-EGSB]